MTAPSIDEKVCGPLRDLESDAVWEMQDEIDGEGWPGPPRHHIGGWPIYVQNVIWTECQLVSNGIDFGGGIDRNDPTVVALMEQVGDWRLLAQIESDDAAEWMWGDVGTLYFAIREQDLAERRFDRTWMTLQCS